MKTAFGYSYYKEIDLAFEIVTLAFCEKKDKGGNPYINHLKSVYERLKAKGYRDEILVVGILHDLLEDCPLWSEDMLRLFFRNCIVNSVVALTRKKNQSDIDYLNCILQDRWAIRVKQADLEDNMDITRLNEVITETDRSRLIKYSKMHKTITSIIRSEEHIKTII